MSISIIFVKYEYNQGKQCKRLIASSIFDAALLLKLCLGNQSLLLSTFQHLQYYNICKILKLLFDLI